MLTENKFKIIKKTCLIQKNFNTFFQNNSFDVLNLIFNGSIFVFIN